MTTKDKILSTALNLFNESGTVKISTNHIADAMGISPGNLYYHYRNKEAIIRKLWENMVEKIHVPFSKESEPAKAEKIVAFLFDFFNIMYEYRFFWLELAVLLGKDPDLKGKYITRSRSLLNLYKITVRNWKNTGFLVQNISEKDLDQLVENTWFLSQYWALHTYIHEENLSRENLRNGVLRIIATIKPYLTADAVAELENILSSP